MRAYQWMSFRLVLAILVGFHHTARLETGCGARLASPWAKSQDEGEDPSSSSGLGLDIRPWEESAGCAPIVASPPLSDGDHSGLAVSDLPANGQRHLCLLPGMWTTLEYESIVLWQAPKLTMAAERQRGMVATGAMELAGQSRTLAETPAQVSSQARASRQGWWQGGRSEGPTLGHRSRGHDCSAAGAASRTGASDSTATEGSGQFIHHGSFRTAPSANHGCPEPLQRGAASAASRPARRAHRRGPQVGWESDAQTRVCANNCTTRTGPSPGGEERFLGAMDQVYHEALSHVATADDRENQGHAGVRRHRREMVTAAPGYKSGAIQAEWRSSASGWFGLRRHGRGGHCHRGGVAEGRSKTTVPGTDGGQRSRDHQNSASRLSGGQRAGGVPTGAPGSRALPTEADRASKATDQDRGQDEDRATRKAGRRQAWLWIAAAAAPHLGLAPSPHGCARPTARPYFGTRHSIMDESDYVCPYFARVLGLRAEFEMKAGDCGINTYLRLDQRESAFSNAGVLFDTSLLCASSCDPVADPCDRRCRRGPSVPSFQTPGDRMAQRSSVETDAEGALARSFPPLKDLRTRPALKSCTIVAVHRACTKSSRTVSFAQQVSFRKFVDGTGSWVADGSAPCQFPCDRKGGSMSDPTVDQQQPPHEPPDRPEPEFTPPHKIRRPQVPSPSQIALLRAESVRIVPEELRTVPIFTNPVQDYSWGRNDENLGAERFTAFDHERHVTVSRRLKLASILEITASAVGSAPFSVGVVKILAVPVQGYPQPQLVLGQLGRAADELPVPWDLRNIHDGVRTIRHSSREPRTIALRAVATAMRVPRDLAQDVALGDTVVADAVGVLTDPLPANLHVMQHCVVNDLPPGFILTADDVPAARPTSTSTTTTAVRVRANTVRAPMLRIVLLRGEVQHSADLGQHGAYIDVLIYQLLQRHNRDHALPEVFALVLASGLPPRLGYVREVFILISEDTSQVVTCWDARSYGSVLATCMTNAAHRAGRLLSQHWQEQGWSLAVNGIADCHCHRNLRDGDFLQPHDGAAQLATTPLSWVLEQLPALQPLAWRLPTSLCWDSFMRCLRHRRQQLGFHFPDVGILRLQGPMHGDVRLRTGRHTQVELAHLRGAVARLSQFPLLEYWDTPVEQPHSALFVSRCPNSDLRTVLVPAPGFPGHYFTALISEAIAELTRVPAAPGTVLVPRRNLRQGDVLLAMPQPQPTEANSDVDDSTGLLQIAMTSNAAAQANRAAKGTLGTEPVTAGARRGSVPTPFGRRKIPPAAPTKVSLSEAIPAVSTTPRGPSLGTGVSSDMFDFIFDEFQWDALCQEWWKIPSLHPAVRAFLTNLRVMQPHDVPEAMQIYVDGSYEAPDEGTPRAGWCLCVLVLVCEEWKWAGFLSASTASGNTASLQAPVSSAFDTELAALVFALAWSVARPVPAAIFFDSQSAGSIASGEATVHQPSTLSSAAAALLHLLALQRRHPCFLHVKSLIKASL